MSDQVQNENVGFLKTRLISVNNRIHGEELHAACPTSFSANLGILLLIVLWRRFWCNFYFIISVTYSRRYMSYDVLFFFFFFFFFLNIHGLQPRSSSLVIEVFETPQYQLSRWGNCHFLVSMFNNFEIYNNT